MVVESLLIFVTEGILTKLTSLAAKEISLAWGYEAELGKLIESLTILQDYLGGAAEKAQDGGNPVKGWVKKLKGIADEADDVFEQINYDFLRKRVELHNDMCKEVLNFFSPSNPILFRLKMAHRIGKINASVAELKSEASFIGLIAKKKDATPQRIREDRETNAIIGKDEIIIGRKDATTDIVTTLTSSDMNQENLSVMAIVGMPGLGKTTLAKSVYHDKSVIGYFEKRIWACVSDPFNIKVILICMLESLNPKATVRENQDAMLNYIKEELGEKRYLLVLDDVWNDDSEKWERLMSHLSKLNSAPGSKIIVTTRSAEVASISEKKLPRQDLELLSTDECWSILKHAACSDGSSDIPHDLERIGREIAKNCEGLPLMAQVLGGILRSKKTPVEWSKVRDSSIWDSTKKEDRIMSVLKLSFDNLESPTLKQCFSYCSAFKKDAEMERDDLIQLWMAQGFLHPSPEKSNLEMEDIGNEYFDILFQRSLFQDAELDDDGIVIKCKMHDLIHNLAERLSETRSMMRDFHEDEDVATPITERIPDGSIGKLRSLFSNAEALPGNMLPWFKPLRVLKLYGAYIEELPSSIGELKHLRYLDISFTNIKRLPNSIGKLYNLQTLRATECKLEEFPKDAQNLINLRHVYCDEGMKFPAGVLGRLTLLQTLPYEEVKGREIEELAVLNQLKGELIICNLEDVRNGDEARIAKLEDKKNVRGLTFVWSEDRSITNNNSDEDVLEGHQPHSENNNDEDVLEGLQPNSELERLEIRYFMGTKFPSWMSKLERSVFPALKELHICCCKELIEWMEGPEQFMVFPRLEKLQMLDCWRLQSLGSSGPQLPASLVELEIRNAHNLESLPSLDNLTSLSELVIVNCGKLKYLPTGQHCYASLKRMVLGAFWEELDSFPDFHLGTGSSQLQMLALTGWPKLKSLPQQIQYFTSLTSLDIFKFDGVEALEDWLGNLTSLTSLMIWSCKKLMYLPSVEAMQRLTKLRRLQIRECPLLKERCTKDSGPEWPKISHIYITFW